MAPLQTLRCESATKPGSHLVLAAEFDDWLDRFHAGHRDVLEECYREHYNTVERAVGRVLHGADKETVVHEVFYTIVADQNARMAFHGGSFAAWISTVARNQSIDFVRRYRKERSLDAEAAENLASMSEATEERAAAQLLVERFRREKLPSRWAPVFEARFIRQLSQRDAARELGMMRTTLAYQELQIRRLLRRFLLRSEALA